MGRSLRSLGVGDLISLNSLEHTAFSNVSRFRKLPQHMVIRIWQSDALPGVYTSSSSPTVSARFAITTFLNQGLLRHLTLAQYAPPLRRRADISAGRSLSCSPRFRDAGHFRAFQPWGTCLQLLILVINQNYRATVIENHLFLVYNAMTTIRAYWSSVVGIPANLDVTLILLYLMRGLDYRAAHHIAQPWAALGFLNRLLSL